MTLHYSITFFDYWHTSSGLSAGAKLDSSVIKDDNNLPYLAGKTIKGLAREVADKSLIDECFGVEGENMGVCYFSNAYLDKQEQEEIVGNVLQNNLYAVIASTTIDSNGIAVDDSLREIEVVVPLTLYGTVKDIPKEHYAKMLQAIKKIKRLGLNRHRGLGRCQFKEVGEKNV